MSWEVGRWGWRKTIIPNPQEKSESFIRICQGPLTDPDCAWLGCDEETSWGIKIKPVMLWYYLVSTGTPPFFHYSSWWSHIAPDSSSFLYTDYSVLSLCPEIQTHITCCLFILLLSNLWASYIPCPKEDSFRMAPLSHTSHPVPFTPILISLLFHLHMWFCFSN